VVVRVCVAVVRVAGRRGSGGGHRVEAVGALALVLDLQLDGGVPDPHAREGLLEAGERPRMGGELGDDRVRAIA